MFKKDHVRTQIFQNQNEDVSHIDVQSSRENGHCSSETVPLNALRRKLAHIKAQSIPN